MAKTDIGVFAMETVVLFHSISDLLSCISADRRFYPKSTVEEGCQECVSLGRRNVCDELYLVVLVLAFLFEGTSLYVPGRN